MCAPYLSALSVKCYNKGAVQINSLDFVINRLFLKLFRTTDIRIISLCQELFNFELPSVQLEHRCKKNREQIFCMVFYLVKFAF